MDLTPNTVIIVLVTAALEALKVYLPDNIEPRILPIAAVVIGGLLGLAIGGNVIIGVVSGLAAAGLYKVAMKGLSKIGNSK
jgi:hypothetical protein